VIKPGESERLSVIIACSKLKGKFARAIRVSTNDAEQPVTQLMCRGQILEPIHLAPRLVNFGRVSRKATSPVRTARITKGDGGPLSLKLKDSKNKSVRAELREVKPGEEYELTVTLEPPFQAPYVRDKLELETGIAQAPVAEVPIYATVTPRVAAVPAAVNIPANVRPNWQQRIAFRWDDENPGHLLEASIQNPALKAEIVDRNNVQQVLLTVTEQYRPRVGRDYLLVKTDDAEMAEVRVPVRYLRSSPAARRPARVAAPRKVTPPRRTPASTVPPSIRKPPPTTQPAPAATGGG
jgi:hypothetical protein